jgi:ABC-type microcin C transport system permease subunit YejE
MPVGRMPTVQKAVIICGTGILPVFFLQMIFSDYLQNNFMYFLSIFMQYSFCRTHTGETPVPRIWVL